MIKFVKWVLGRRVRELDAETADAEQDVRVSRALRTNAEQIGKRQRIALANNHFGERMAAALEPRGYAE